MKLVKDNIIKITDDPTKIEKLLAMGYELTGVEIVEGVEVKETKKTTSNKK